MLPLSTGREANQGEGTLPYVRHRPEQTRRKAGIQNIENCTFNLSRIHPINKLMLCLIGVKMVGPNQN
jgi:hypothetical protein